MADASQLNQLKMDTKTTLKASDIRIHNFSIDARGSNAAGVDVMEQMARAARKTAQSQSSGGGIKAAPIELDYSSLRADLGDEGPEGPPLREAKRMISQQHFDDALAKLEEVLTLAPDHHEAYYLQALCHHKKNRVQPALETLRKLRTFSLSNRLKTLVRVLQEEIRQQILPKATQIYEGAMKGKNGEQAIEQLRQFAECDPDVGKFHCYLAGALFVGKRVLEARQAAANGLEVCDSDREDLQTLYDLIDKRCMTEVLDPARRLFRTKQYAAAEQALQSAPAEFHKLPQWQAFHGFAERLAGKGGGGFFARLLGGGAAAHEPPGTPDVVRALYEFLVEPEMNAARAAITANNHAAAEPALQAAIGFTPGFALANHMLATCVYQRVGQQVAEKIGQDLDDRKANELRICKQQLDNVRERAVVASRDKDQVDGARLLASIDEMRSQIETVVVKYEVQIHDAKLVNQVIDDFFEVIIRLIMIEAAIKNSSSRHEILRTANELYDRVVAMRNRLPTLRGQCRGTEARQIMDNLKKNFVDPHYNMLSKIMGR
jgi:tetratricopeptide (TPR) repeat protein